MAWVQRPSGLIESGGKRKCFLKEATLIQVDNVSWKRILIINLNRYWIVVYTLGEPGKIKYQHDFKYICCPLKTLLAYGLQLLLNPCHMIQCMQRLGSACLLSLYASVLRFQRFTTVSYGRKMFIALALAFKTRRNAVWLCTLHQLSHESS